MKNFATNPAIQRIGKKVIVDWDDNLFQVSPLSPHYKDFGDGSYAMNTPEENWIYGSMEKH